VSFARLRAADWVVLVASLALLFTMATDWYTTNRGEEARDVQQNLEQLPPEADERQNALDDARTAAEAQEENAWQASGAVDRLILVVLLATVALAILSAFLRAAGRSFDPPYTPSSLTALVAGTGALLLLFRMIQEPGFDEATVVKAGLPLTMVVLGVVALAAVVAFVAEEESELEHEFDEVPRPEAESPA